MKKHCWDTSEILSVNVNRNYGSRLSGLEPIPSDVVCLENTSYSPKVEALNIVGQDKEVLSEWLSGLVTDFTNIFLRNAKQGD